MLFAVTENVFASEFFRSVGFSGEIEFDLHGVFGFKPKLDMSDSRLVDELIEENKDNQRFRYVMFFNATDVWFHQTELDVAVMPKERVTLEKLVERFRGACR